MLAVTINSRFRAYWSAILPLLLSRSPASGLHTQVAEVRRNDCFSNSRSTTAQLRTCFISAPQRTLDPCHDAEAFAEHLDTSHPAVGGFLVVWGQRALFRNNGARACERENHARCACASLSALSQLRGAKCFRFCASSSPSWTFFLEVIE